MYERTFSPASVGPPSMRRVLPSGSSMNSESPWPTSIKCALSGPAGWGTGFLASAAALRESTSLASMCWDMKEAALSKAASMSASLMAERSLAA